MKNCAVACASLLAFLSLADDAFGAIPVGGYAPPVDRRVSPLVDSAWGQTTATGFSDGKRCYNYYIANQVDSARDYSGCLSVAVAQLMRKWRYGSIAKDVSVSCVVSRGLTEERKPLKTLGGPYDWNNMPSRTADAEPTDVQCKAIGRLIYDIAVASGSVFTPTGTFAVASVVRARLSKRGFGYANAEDVYFNGRNCPFSVEVLERLVIPSLDFGAPVILSVSPEGSEAIHAMLVDGYGYDDDGRLLLHVNIGVLGNGDGWYRADEGIRVADVDYTIVRECLYNIFPTSMGTAVSGRVLAVSRRPVQDASVQVFSNGTCVAASVVGANGVYAFVLAAGSYVVRASYGDRSVERTLEVEATESRQFAGDFGDGRYLDDPDHAPLIGNSFGNDLLLPEVYSGQADAPTISPSSRTIDCATSVSIACDTPDAVIHYTLDGSEPTLQSPVYTVPLVITDSVTVKAAAFARGLEPSVTTRATFVYSNASNPAGNSRTSPAMLSGENVTRTIHDYATYVRAEDDPVVDWDLWQLCYENAEYLTESHSVWFRWTAPGSGTVRITSVVAGPEETGYYLSLNQEMSDSEENQYPRYGVIMASYVEGSVSAAKAIARSQSKYEVHPSGSITMSYHEFATNEFSVIQGETYLIQCECPYHLVSDYIDKGFYQYGPCLYKWDAKKADWDVVPFQSDKAYLSLSLSANLTDVPSSVARLTVPAMVNATVQVQSEGKLILTAPGTMPLAAGVSYAVIYTAAPDYRFASESTTWTAVVRDDAGMNFSIADFAGYPSAGPTQVISRRSVTARPEMAVGTFNGFVLNGEQRIGTFTLTATDAGKLTAKVITAGGTVSFSGTRWDSVEDGVYKVSLATKKGEKLSLAVDSNASWDENQLSGTCMPATGRTLHVTAQRNVLEKTWYLAVVGNERNGWTFAYAKDAKSAALTVTLKADGSTAIAGSLPNGMDAKGKAVSLKVRAAGYANVGGMTTGAIIADFAPIVTVNKVKRTLSIRTNLWFDRSNDHVEGLGEAHLKQ